MKQCENCKKKLGKLEGEGIQYEECQEIFVVCMDCIKNLSGANCPHCGNFCIIFLGD